MTKIRVEIDFDEIEDNFALNLFLKRYSLCAALSSFRTHVRNIYKHSDLTQKSSEDLIAEIWDELTRTISEHEIGDLI